MGQIVKQRENWFLTQRVGQKPAFGGVKTLTCEDYQKMAVEWWRLNNRYIIILILEVRVVKIPWLMSKTQKEQSYFNFFYLHCKKSKLFCKNEKLK